MSPKHLPLPKHPIELFTEYNSFTEENSLIYHPPEDKTPYFITAGLCGTAFFVTIIIVICCRHGKFLSNNISEASGKQHKEEIKDRKGSLRTWTSQNEDNITVPRADSEIDSIGNPEYPFTNAGHIYGSDITSMAVTIGGGMSAPPELNERNDTCPSENANINISTEAKMFELGLFRKKELKKAHEYEGDDISL